MISAISAQYKKFVINIKVRKVIILKFLIFSGSAVLLNLIMLFIMVNYMGFNTPLGENFANAISMELSVIYNFFVSRYFTWKDRPRERGTGLLIQMLKFHLTIGATLLFRLFLFPVLQFFGVFYIINSAIGIIISAIFNFVIYDLVIFKKKEQ